MIKGWIASLETAPMSVAGWLAGFAGVIWVRYFLESFSSPGVSGYLSSDLPTLLHYTLYYIAAITLTVVIVSAITRISPSRMMRAIIFILPIMWLGPLVDLIRGGSTHISYLFVADSSVLLHDFFTYFGPLTGEGATFGLRIELGLLIVMLGTYVYVHTKRLTATLLSMFVVYAVVFVSAVLPSLIAFLLPTGAGDTALFVALQSALISHDFLHPSETYSIFRTIELLFDAVIAQVLYLIFCVSGIMWLYSVRKDAVIAMFRNIRLERLTHFIIVAFLGGLIALAGGSRINWTILDFITVAVAVVTIVFTCIFAIVTNDLVDEPIDAISNTSRPLITGALTKKMMQDAGLVTGLLALAGALTLGSYATFWILAFTATYYIYSVPPLRLKRIPILASAFIGIATLTMMLLGFFLVSTNQMLSAFPTSIALLTVFFMTLITNVRDLKDIEGDTAAGIWTVPTLLGDRLARRVIGGMTCIAYILVPLFIPVKSLWAPSLLVGIVSWLGLIRGKGERFAFALYFLYLASVVLILYFA